MKLRLGCNQMLYFLLIINTLLSLAFDSTKIYYFYILGPIIAIMLTWLMRKNKRNMIVVFIMYILLIFNVVNAWASNASLSNFGKINNHFFNYIDVILLLLYFSKDNRIREFWEYTLEKKNLLKLVVLITILVELFYLITGKGYQLRWNWGRGNFFRGTSNSEHTLSYLMIVILIYIIFLLFIEGKKRIAILSVIPLYAIFESGARAALILAVFPLMMIVDLVFTRKQKQIFVKVVAFSGLCALTLLFLKDQILQSNLFIKIIARNDSGNSSAGRLYIWSDLISKYIHDSSISQYLMGQGDYMIYKYNAVNPLVNVEVWAHNDFLQILVGKGLIGVLLYVSSGIKCFYNVIKKNKSLYSIFPILMIVLAAMVNGFYNYKDLSLQIPFIVGLSRYYNQDLKSI